MKIRCRECGKIFDDKDIVIDGEDYTDPFTPWCKKCHQKEYPEEYKK